MGASSLVDLTMAPEINSSEYRRQARCVRRVELNEYRERAFGEYRLGVAVGQTHVPIGTLVGTQLNSGTLSVSRPSRKLARPPSYSVGAVGLEPTTSTV